MDVCVSAAKPGVAASNPGSAVSVTSYGVTQAEDSTVGEGLAPSPSDISAMQIARFDAHPDNWKAIELPSFLYCSGYYCRDSRQCARYTINDGKPKAAFWARKDMETPRCDSFEPHAIEEGVDKWEFISPV